MTRFACAALASMVSACGGGSIKTSGTATVHGTFSGNSIAAADAIATNANTKVNGFTLGSVVITSFGNACTLAGGSKKVKNGRTLVLLFADVSQSGSTGTAPTAAGTYTVVAPTATTLPPHYAEGFFTSVDASCVESDVDLTSGTVTLARAGPGYAGSFDVSTTAGDHVTGSFDGGDCAALAAPPPKSGCQ